jgi:tetratricopeptide (TPR) repeat protein
MSSELIAAMRAQPGLGALPWDDARVRALKESCPRPGGPGAEDDDLRTLSYVLMGLSWPDFRGLSTVSVFYLDAIRRRRPEWFSDVPALVRKTRNPQTEVYGISMAPESLILPRFYWHIGEVRMLEKDFAGAARDIGKALALDPSLSWARVSLAAAEGLRGSKARALAQLEEAGARSKEDPRHGAVLASAVAAGLALGLEGAQRISSSDPDHWIGKAEAAAAAGRPAEALSALERARALKPRPDQLRSIAQRYFILREHGKFLEVFEPLAAAYPGDGDLWLSCAEAAFESGRRERGRAALARAEALAPGPAQRRVIAGLRARFAK